MDLDMVLQPGPEEPEIPKSMVPSFWTTHLVGQEICKTNLLMAIYIVQT